MEMLAGCCHNEKVEIKSDNYSPVQQIANAGFIPVSICVIAFPILDFSSHFQNSQSNFLTYLDNSHPPAHPDIIILVRSFLI